MQTLTKGIDGGSGDSTDEQRVPQRETIYCAPRATYRRTHTREHAHTHKSARGNIIYASLTHTAVLVSMKCSICDSVRQ